MKRLAVFQATDIVEGVDQPTVFSEGVTCQRIEDPLNQLTIFLGPTVREEHVIPSADFSISHPYPKILLQLIKTDLINAVDEQLGLF